MYGKSAVIEVCEHIFNENQRQSSNNYNVNVYNAMIHAYGRNGELSKAMQLFSDMTKVTKVTKPEHDEQPQRLQQRQCIIPDRKTFILLLSACSHSGDVETAKYIWREKIMDDDIKYDDYVMTALVDCMARKGDVYLMEAKELLLQNMGRYDSLDKEEIAWTALLSGCSKHNDYKMAEDVHKEMNKRFGVNAFTDRIATASTLLEKVYAES